MRDHDDEQQTTPPGRDELNFAEFPLALIGKRAPQNLKTLQFEDEITDRRTGRPVKRKLTISAADVLGLPTAIDDEVMLACLQLSHARKFADRKVTFRRSEFLDLLGWKRSGHHYKRLAESLRRWKGTLIISENGFWDKGGSRWVNDSFSLLDRVHLSGRGAEESGIDDNCYFVWGDFMWRSIEAGNLRALDFEFIKSLESGIAKRLYRLLGKRFYHTRCVTFDLKRLAFEKVGLSRNMHTGQIKEKLKAGHRELESRGVCKSQYIERSRGEWDVVYTTLPVIQTKRTEKPAAPTLVELLASRGVEHPERLVKKHPAERIREAIENFDDRLAYGEKLTPGWLVKCITNSTPYEFRRGYVRQADNSPSRNNQKQRAAAEKARLAREREVSKEERVAFEDFLAGLDDHGRNEFSRRALKGNSFRARHYRRQLETCSPESSAGVEREAIFAYWLTCQRSGTEDLRGRKETPDGKAA